MEDLEKLAKELRRRISKHAVIGINEYFEELSEKERLGGERKDVIGLNEYFEKIGCRLNLKNYDTTPL